MSISNWIKQHGASLTFTASGARLNLEEATKEHNKRSIVMDLALESGRDVRLPDNRSLKSARWRMYLVEKGAPTEEQKSEAVGVLSYFEESSDDYHTTPEECHLEVAFDADSFHSLLTSLQAGRIPDWVSVRVQGLEHGWEPDGSGKVWDVKETPQAPVISVSFGIPLTAPQARTPANDNDDEVGSTLPASSADILELRSTMANQTALLVNALWKSVTVIVAVALVLLLIRS